MCELGDNYTGDPDQHGPFAGYYRSWFSTLKKAADYQSKRV